jgi:hypothetical protein
VNEKPSISPLSIHKVCHEQSANSIFDSFPCRTMKCKKRQKHTKSRVYKCGPTGAADLCRPRRATSLRPECRGGKVATSQRRTGKSLQMPEGLFASLGIGREIKRWKAHPPCRRKMRSRLRSEARELPLPSASGSRDFRAKARSVRRGSERNRPSGLF